jgi:NADH-quinone oxidoreductase subunit I
MWAEVRDGALKKLQGAVKRRPGVAGIAPQMVERASAIQAALNDSPAPISAPPAQSVAVDTTAAQSAALPANPPAGQGKAGQEPSVNGADARAPTEQPSGESSADPKDAKAAKLAAIRAANAAKAAQPAAPTSPEPTTNGTAEAAPIVQGDSPAEPSDSIEPIKPKDAKAKRLAAIRAANAAKDSKTPKDDQ